MQFPVAWAKQRYYLNIYGEKFANVCGDFLSSGSFEVEIGGRLQICIIGQPTMCMQVRQITLAFHPVRMMMTKGRN